MRKMHILKLVQQDKEEEERMEAVVREQIAKVIDEAESEIKKAELRLAAEKLVEADQKLRLAEEEKRIAFEEAEKIAAAVLKRQ